MIGVVDTSAVLRLFIPDGPEAPGLRGFLQQVCTGRHVAVAPQLIGGAMQLARDCNLSVYDALFLELTRQTGGQLFTCDRRLQKAGAGIA